MTAAETNVLLALIGAAGGLISGAAGLAGGIVLVPGLVALFGPSAMGDAIVVSFFAVLFNSLSSTVENFKARGPQAFWPLIAGARPYTLGAAAAALCVAVLCGQHKEAVSKVLLASLQLMLALCMLVPRRWYENLRAVHNHLKDATVGSIVGGISTLIGVGGGTYTMVYFMVHGRQIKDCTLTCNFVGIFIGLMGVVGWFGATHFALHGAVNLQPSVIDAAGKAILILCGVAACPLGVRLQSRLPAASLRKLVVGVLAASAAYVLFGALAA